MTELPITHFKPKEIFVSIEKLKLLGYTKDIYDKSLEDEEQVLELMPHDIILPCSSESGDDRADEVFINIAEFIDNLLERFYHVKKFYNIKSRDYFDFNTYIPIKNNNQWEIVKIGELVEKLNPDKVVDNFGTKEKKVDGY